MFLVGWFFRGEQPGVEPVDGDGYDEGEEEEVSW